MPKKKSPVSIAPSWYSIRAAEDSDTAEVLIYGDIGESWFGESVTAKQFAEDLKAVADKKLIVRINSYGGSVADGVTIYNAIRRHPLDKTTVVDGVAVSIASLIAMAGDTVQMGENTLLMIHAPWGYAQGNAAVMREYADVLDTYAKAMATSYATQTGESVEEMLALLNDGKDHWYTAQEALDAGFVDEITAASEGTAAEAASLAAQYRAQAFSRFHVPAAVAAAFNPKETIMPNKIPNTPATPAAGAEPAPAPSATNVVQIEEAAVARERERLTARNTTIRAAAKPFMARDGIAALVEEIIADPHTTTEQAREKILAKLGDGAEPLNRMPGVITGGQDERDKRVLAMGGALAARMGAGKEEGANPYRGMRLHELARACLRASGVNPDGMSQLDVATAVLTRQMPRGAQTTSDFPVILENTLHKLVLTGFVAQPGTYERFCKIGDVSDFRAWNRLVPGLIGNLDTVTESGEYKNKNIPDAQKNSVQATRKGNIINITPEVLVNDDTGYIQAMAQSLGAAGPRAIERAVYTLLNSNPNLSDGVAVFATARGNLAGSGAVPSVTTLDVARQAMASRTAPGTDAEYLDIRPAVAVVPLAQGGNTRVLVNAVYDPDTANKLQKPNMVNGIVKDVVDSPRLSGTAWYLFADPNVAPVIEVVFLDGQRTPTVTEEVNFRTSGLAWKVELPFGAGYIGHHGGYKNPGA